MLNAQGRCPVTVPFDDIDSYRIAHHTRLVAYLERARLQLFLSLGFALGEDGYAAVVYAMKLDFKKPARLLDELEVSSEITAIEACKLVLTERIVRNGELVMKSRTEMVFLDPADGLPVPVEVVVK
jgi:YbgC/YbaW family acyl-CoA thioester hydrolase